MNEPDALYCEVDGAPLRAGAPSQIAATGGGGLGFLIMPDHNELSLSQATRTVGRADLVKFVKQEQTTEIGRAHLTLSQENGVYYLQDGGPDPSNPQAWKPSVNKTYLNGEMLQPGEKRPLKPNDVISVAGLVNLTFKTR
jgi:pSer/pThr/pTyr-binding forkhead associated (FHA) protein